MSRYAAPRCTPTRTAMSNPKRRLIRSLSWATSRAMFQTRENRALDVVLVCGGLTNTHSRPSPFVDPMCPRTGRRSRGRALCIVPPRCDRSPARCESTGRCSPPGQRKAVSACVFAVVNGRREKVFGVRVAAVDRQHLLGENTCGGVIALADGLECAIEQFVDLRLRLKVAHSATVTT